MYQSLKNSLTSWVVITKAEIMGQLNYPGLQNQLSGTQVNQKVKVS